MLSNIDLWLKGLSFYSSFYIVAANLKVANNIIFSFWKKTLHIIASLFTHRGLPFVLIDGSVALADRTKSLTRFKNDPSIPVLLMTLGTGAVGYILFSFSSPLFRMC